MNTTRISIAVLALTACTTRTETAPAPAPASADLGRSVQTGAGGAAQHGKQSDRTAENVLQTSLDYYDGDDKRSVWLSNELVAEFAPTDAGKDALLRSDSAAQEVPQAQKGVRIWRVRALQGTDTFARNASSTELRVSPVLHDSASGGLPLRALPGGVVVTFPPSWDRAHIDTWLTARKLKVESDVVASANMYLIATPAGLEAIRMANELHETGELVAATPNFWQQVQAR